MICSSDIRVEPRAVAISVIPYRPSPRMLSLTIPSAMPPHAGMTQGGGLEIRWKTRIVAARVSSGARRSRESRIALQQRANEVDEVAHIEGLAQQHAVLDAKPVQIEAGSGGEEQDSGAARLLVSTQMAVNLGAAEARQSHIQQH